MGTMDFSKRVTFAGVVFKPTKNGVVRWTTVQKMLESGKVECTWYNYDDHQTETGMSPSTAQNVLGQVEMFEAERCYISENGPNGGNPRYSSLRYICVRIHTNMFATIYDLADLPELADGTEVEEVEVEACEACVGCDVVPDEPEALVEKGGLRLIVSN